MIERSSSCTTSIGSSIVTMWARRVRLMWPIIEAIVVVLPVPVGPVTSTSPRGESASVADHGREQELLDRRDLRAHPADREPDHPALAEDVDRGTGRRPAACSRSRPRSRPRTRGACGRASARSRTPPTRRPRAPGTGSAGARRPRG